MLFRFESIAYYTVVVINICISLWCNFVLNPNRLCKDLAPGAVVSPNTIVLPNSLLTHNQETKSTHSCSSESSELPVSTKPTAIGRFTVAPSNKVNEPTSHSSSGRCARGSLTSESNQASAHHKNVHNFEYGNREHHSLTSALPNTLKRAIMQVSRNLTGGGTPTTSNEESSNRGTAQLVTGTHSPLHTSFDPVSKLYLNF